MLFNTAPFFLFLFVVLALFYALPPRFRRYLLVAASYFFYASWNWRFIPLLLALTATDFAAAIWMERAPERKRPLLILGLSANLGFLGFFKYYNFVAWNLSALHLPHHYLKIILPLGISFHTFQSMSYLVDVYRGEQEAVRDPWDYALFICFFPQLVAGPIVRARNFFHDLFGWKAPTVDDVSRGMFLTALGLTKKMAFADRFAIVADNYFNHVGDYAGASTAWSGVFAFAMQIYFDFSGYTDMAIGMALLFGFHFPENFRRPYLATSLTDFWRRWHISLSSWLRDYLYIPLGGSRRGTWNTYRNLMITMVLGGLWHGANWRFLLWGAYHGAILSIERVVLGARAAHSDRTWRYPLRALFTFAMAMIGWVFFRAGTTRDLAQILAQMFTRGGVSLLEPWHWGLAGLALAIALAEEHASLTERFLEAPVWVQTPALTLMLFILEMFGVIDRAIPFVYFQF